MFFILRHIFLLPATESWWSCARNLLCLRYMQGRTCTVRFWPYVQQPDIVVLVKRPIQCFQPFYLSLWRGRPRIPITKFVRRSVKTLAGKWSIDPCWEAYSPNSTHERQLLWHMWGHSFLSQACWGVLTEDLKQHNSKGLSRPSCFGSAKVKHVSLRIEKQFLFPFCWLQWA